MPTALDWVECGPMTPPPHLHTLSPLLSVNGYWDVPLTRQCSSPSSRYKITYRMVRSVLPGGLLQPLASNWSEPKTLSQTTCHGQNSANNHKHLESDASFPIWAAHENSAPLTA